jgi:hypothetical protein
MIDQPSTRRTMRQHAERWWRSQAIASCALVFLLPVSALAVECPSVAYRVDCVSSVHTISASTRARITKPVSTHRVACARSSHHGGCTVRHASAVVISHS